ncbi:MAG: hypothetical protein SFX72_06355 [Isosphaeraceae bacterium]|nr:hypothetical protein [Isosphaeraceae bacterium]
MPRFTISTASRLALLTLLAGSGCAFVPKQRLDDSQRVIDGLRAENSRLKDSALSLRTQTQDLNQRAVDDARRISMLEESRLRLEKSVQAYIDERETLNEAFQTLQRETAARLEADAARLR